MPKLDHILKTLNEERSALTKEFSVKRIGVFGSFVRKEARKNSDLDILIEFTEAPGMFAFLRLEEHLTKKLGVKVDLVMKSALKPAIGKRIMKEVHFI